MTRYTTLPNRREFVRTALRGTLLTGLIGLAGLTLRGRSIVWSAPPCRESGGCATCQLLARCGLPPAAAIRQTSPPA